MKLADYIHTASITPRELRRLLGITNRSTVHRYLHHARIPQPRLMQRVIEVTKGGVTLADFLDETPPECAEVITRPDGTTRWVFPWSRDEPDDHDPHEPPEATDEEELSQPVQRALAALGPRARPFTPGVWTVDGKTRDLRGLVAAANEQLRSANMAPIAYPGVQEPHDE